MFTLLPHQQDTINWTKPQFAHLNQKRFGLFYAPRTGKTFILLFLAAKFNVKCLIIVPKALEAQWNTYNAQYSQKIHTVITKETFRRDHASLEGYDGVIIDEAHHFANPRSALTKALMAYLTKYAIQYRWPATGTPYRSNPMNIYALARIIGVNWNYRTFINTFYYEVKMGHRMIPMPKPHMEDELEAKIKEIGITLSIESVHVDYTQPEVYVEQFELTLEQRLAIRAIRESLPIQRFAIQHQIENGFKYSDGYDEERSYPSHKTARLFELVNKYGKIAIVCKYTAQLDFYERMFTRAKKKVFVISGKTPDRAAIIEEIKTTRYCVVLIQAQCSEGYTLASITVMVFATLPWSHVDHIQMKERLVDLNKSIRNVYYYLNAGEIDPRIYQTIMNKQDFHEKIFLNPSYPQQ
jgi:superfamily II DNA or RNA helicase